MALAVVERKEESVGVTQAETLRRRFQNLVVGEADSDRLIAAWRDFAAWEEAMSSLGGASSLNYRRLAEMIAAGRRIYNPASRFAFVTCFRVRTIGLNGRVGTLLQGLEEEEMAQAADFCERMIEMVEEPQRVLLGESGSWVTIQNKD